MTNPGSARLPLRSFYSRIGVLYQQIQTSPSDEVTYDGGFYIDLWLHPVSNPAGSTLHGEAETSSAGRNRCGANAACGASALTPVLALTPSISGDRANRRGASSGVPLPAV